MQGIKTGASPSGILTRHAGEDLRGRALSPHPLDRLSGGGGNPRRILPPPQTDPRSQIAKSYISQLSKMQSHAGGGGELDQRKFFKSRRSLQPISITIPTMLAKRDLRGSAPSFAPPRVTIRGDPSAPPLFGRPNQRYSRRTARVTSGRMVSSRRRRQERCARDRPIAESDLELSNCWILPQAGMGPGRVTESAPTGAGRLPDLTRPGLRPPADREHRGPPPDGDPTVPNLPDAAARHEGSAQRAPPHTEPSAVRIGYTEIVTGQVNDLGTLDPSTADFHPKIRRNRTHGKIHSSI